MSDANRVGLTYIGEASFAGAKDSTTHKALRWTGEDLHQEQETQDSAEIRDDAQVSDIVRTNISAMGGFNLELSYGAYDDLLQYAARSAGWSTPVTVTATTISASSVDNSFNDSGNGFGSIVAGQWIKVSGFAAAANNGFFKVLTAAAGKLVVKGSGSLTTAAASPSITIVMGAQITNGITQKSIYVEKKFSDLSNIFNSYEGLIVNAMNLNFPVDQIITGSFGFVGKREVKLTATASSAITDAPTNEVMAGVDDIQVVYLGQSDGIDLLDEVNNFSMALNNNLRPRRKVGTLGAFGVGMGSINLTGSLQAYFSDQTLLDYFRDFEETGFAAAITDSAGNSYVIDIPSIKFATGAANATGINTDVMSTMTWRAKMNADEEITFRIARFPAA
jgi:hypothetical protein